MNFPELTPGLPADFLFPDDFLKSIEKRDCGYWVEWENWMIVYFEEYEHLDYGESEARIMRAVFDCQTGAQLEDLGMEVYAETIFFQYQEYAARREGIARKDFRELVMQTIRERN